jgi:hypothetical protein
MKKLLKIVGVLVVVGIVAVLGLQIFFNRGLTPVAKKMLPKISENIGVPVGLDKVSINLFHGSLNIKKLNLGNPDGFEEKNVFALDSAGLDVGLKALLDRTVRISDASVKNAVITIVRNDAGDVNLTQINKNLQKKQQAPAESPQQQPEAAPEPSQPTAPATANEAAELPKFIVDNLKFGVLFEFVDHKTTNAQPNRIGLDLKLDAENIVTFGNKPEADWGTINIKGGLHEKPELFAVDVIVRTAPLTDPAKPSFSAKGKVASIDMRNLGAIPDEIGIIGSSADIELNIIVKDGNFEKGSKMVATLHDARLLGKLARKHKKTKLPPDLSITIPVAGSLAEPDVNIVQAITASILRNISKNPDYLLDNITVDGKSLRDKLNHAIDKKLK